MILDVLDESSVWCLGINKICTTLRHTEACFSEDVVPLHLLKMMRGAVFVCIHHCLLLNFTPLFHVSNTHFAKEYVTCEGHHLFIPLYCTPWSSDRRHRHVYFGSLFSSIQWHLATSQLGITCWWNTRMSLPILRLWCPAGQGLESRSNRCLHTDIIGAVTGILIAGWGS